MQDGTGDSEVDAAVAAYKSAVENDENLSKWPAMNALVLPKAIENIRKRITEEATHGDDHAA